VNTARMCAGSRVVNMQAPLLPLEDSDTSHEASQPIAMVRQCVGGLTKDCQEPEQLLESISTTLRSADHSNPQAAIRKVKAAHIAISCIPSVCPLLLSR
jgi:hypothetical protein